MSDSNAKLPLPDGNDPVDAANRGKTRTGTSPDPKLRSFLRQAAAIISAERGLNDVTSAKLQLLAQRLGLSDETFGQAMQTLKQPKRDLVHLTRYEQSFVDLLKKEMPQIPSRILTIKMEQQLIDIANRKYQISEIRAQQLIQKTAEEINVETISHADAEHFAAQLIVDSIGSSSQIDAGLIERLKKSGRKWGLTETAIDKIINRVLAKNRSRQRKSWMAKGLVLLAGVATICGIAYGVSTIDWFGEGIAVKPDQAPRKIDDRTEPVFLSWWPNRLRSRLTQWNGDDKRFDNLVRYVASDPSQQRGSRYTTLTQSLLDPTRESAVLFDRKLELASELYYAEPDDRTAAQLVLPLFDAIDAHRGSVPMAVSQVSRAHRATGLLGQIRFYSPSGHELDDQVERRRQILIDEIADVFGSGYSDLSEYLGETRKALSVDQWYHAIRVGFLSPSRAAVLVPEIDKISQSNLDKRVLGQLRTNALQVILESDFSNWTALKPTIITAIRDSNSTQVKEWISLFLKIDDRGFSDFLSDQLIKHTGVQSASGSRADIFNSLTEFQRQGKHDHRTALLQRFEDVQNVMSRVTRNMESVTGDNALLTDDRQQKLPEIIAQLAYTSNLMMALEKSIDSSVEADDTFAEFDLLRSVPLPRIRFLVRSGQNNLPESVFRGTPTASEIRTKRQSIERLATTDASRIATRKTSIKTLAEISNRFYDINYDEATRFAGYLLSEKSLEEWLTVEQMLPKFQHWPTLKLAIADQLHGSDVQIDQALTLAKILADSESHFDLAGNWRREIGLWLKQMALDQLTDPAGDEGFDSSWNSLRTYLADALAVRARCIGDLSPSGDDIQDICQGVLEAIRSKLQVENIPDGIRLRSAVEQVYDRDEVEITRCVMVNQILINWLTNRVSFMLDKNAETRAATAGHYDHLSLELQDEGTRLYFSEVTIMRLSYWLLKLRIESRVR